MKSIILPAILLCFSVSAKSQAANPDTATDRVFTKVEQEATFPGGDPAWINYVRTKMEKKANKLTRAGNYGTCTVQFIVDKEGNVTHVEALTMKGTKLAEFAVDIIAHGPKWAPAEQRGKKVVAYRRQNIIFVRE